jgi:hypothetical protein
MFDGWAGNRKCDSRSGTDAEKSDANELLSRVRLCRVGVLP